MNRIMNQPFDIKIVGDDGTHDQISFKEFANMLGFEVETLTALPVDPEPVVPDLIPDGNFPFAPDGYDLVMFEDFSPPVFIQNAIYQHPQAAWNDRFHKWNVTTLEGNNDEGNKIYIPGKTHALTSAGQLALMAFANDQSETGFSAGMISSEQLYVQRYGYWETKINPINVPEGYHLAVWLLRADGVYQPKKGIPSEIDMVEIVNGNGNTPNVLNFTDHPSSQGLTKTTWNGSPITLGVLVEPAGVTWYLDGAIVRSSAHHYEEPMYFLVTWEVGSDWPGPVTDKAAVARVDIDYVAAFRRMPFGENIPTL